MAVQIRAAEAADIEQITAIFAEAVLNGTATFETAAPSTEVMLHRFESLTASGHPYLAAVQDDGTLLGYAYAGPYRTRPAYRFTVEDAIYLDPKVRGRGIGRSLLEALVAEAGLRGFAEMIAVIGDARNGASIGLHERVGFARVGTLHRVGFKFDRWIDSVLMQRSLRPR